VHATTEDKSDDMKRSFYEETELVLDQILKCHVRILLGDFNSKVGRKVIIKSLGIRVCMRLITIMGSE
jgi:hypothetical protein